VAGKQTHTKEARRSCREARRDWTIGHTPDARQAAYTVNRARPFARRRASTLRPFFVLMRFLNPCSRFRFRFDGC
jgi:hypothetical protein